MYVLGLAEESVHGAVHQLLVHLNVRELIPHIPHCLAEETIRDRENVGFVNDRQELLGAESVRKEERRKREETRFSRTFSGKLESHLSDAS